MIDGKMVLAIIPARAASKGLPGKNSRTLCGKPLVAWTIEKAKKSRYADEILLTTDSQEIANIGRDLGISVPFMRPKNLADDRSSTYDVIRHGLKHYRDNERKEFHYTVLMEPTSPLREDDDIDRMLEMLNEHADSFDSIISVGEAMQHPSLMKRLAQGKVEPFFPELTQTGRRQDNSPGVYFPFGVAYIAKTDALLLENTFYTSRCLSFVIKRYQNFEIDDLYDFLCIENVMKYEWKLE